MDVITQRVPLYLTLARHGEDSHCFTCSWKAQVGVSM
jgi:hypothetical protein